jgi:hypothetical protein
MLDSVEKVMGTNIPVNPDPPSNRKKSGQKDIS